MKIQIARNFITKEISPNVSVSVIEASDFDEDELATNDWIYYCLEGKLILGFGSEKVELEKDDSCLIKAGTPYRMTGTFKTVIVSQPAFGLKK